jgi:Fe2+ or Zn2+ uptake regulation protein
MNSWKQQAMKRWSQQVKMSWQERWVLRALASESLTLAELRSMLPEHDARAPRVQSASLSRSLKRLAERGLVASVASVNHNSARADSTPR